MHNQKQLNVPIDAILSKKVDEYCQQSGLKKRNFVTKALEHYLSVSAKHDELKESMAWMNGGSTKKTGGDWMNDPAPPLKTLPKWKQLLIKPSLGDLM